MLFHGWWMWVASVFWKSFSGQCRILMSFYLACKPEFWYYVRKSISQSNLPKTNCVTSVRTEWHLFAVIYMQVSFQKLTCLPPRLLFHFSSCLLCTMVSSLVSPSQMTLWGSKQNAVVWERLVQGYMCSKDTASQTGSLLGALWSSLQISELAYGPFLLTESLSPRIPRRPQSIWYLYIMANLHKKYFNY